MFKLEVKMPKRDRSKILGFSLIEVSVMVAILGVMSVALLSSNIIKKEHGELVVDKSRIDDIKSSINSFYIKYGYIPCPASGTDLPSSSSFGQPTDCSAAATSGVSDPAVPGGYASSDAIRTGVVPTRALLLPDSYMMDEWGNRISYSVIKNLAIDQATFDAYSTSVSTGVMQINDRLGTQVTASSTDTVVVYTLVSHGKDKKGAYSKKGVSVVSCGSTAMDSENCDDDYVFVESIIDDTESGANFYYDNFAYITRDVLGVTSASTIGGGSTLANYIYAGLEHSCGLDNAGSIWCWGRGQYGRLGSGSTSTYATPFLEDSASSWKSLAFGGATRHSCGIKDDDTLWCWGRGLYGRLGGGNLTDGLVPQPNYKSTWKWKYVSTGGNSTCAIRDDDKAYCWGQARYYKLGNGSTLDKDIPQLVNSGADNWKKIAPGGQFTCGIKSDDTLWCWGRNNQGQLGTNTYPHTNATPAEVAGGGSWKDIASGGTASCAIKSDDTLWCWGYNNQGQLGVGDVIRRTAPTVVDSGSSTWAQVSFSDAHTCGIKLTDSSMWCWGYNNYSQLGDGLIVRQLTPKAIAVGETWTNVSVYGDHSCGIKTDGTAWCWGNGIHGPLGDGISSIHTQTTPSLVLDGHTWGN